MGVNIGGLVQARTVRLTDLVGKIIGIDGHNVSYQFLARIRNSGTGEPLRDRRGRVTSHISGIFYRTSNFVEAGIKPFFVWDGKPPKFKRRTLKERQVSRATAKKKWFKALERGEEAMTYAQASSKLTPKMVNESIELLDYMGIPSIRAPSEGEAQLATMTTTGNIWACASQDWDSLLFNAIRLVRNLSITGRRKLPKKNVYIEIKPEVVELRKVLNSLDITREQLIIIGILIGNDYNPGVKGVGPKKALHLVKEYKTLDCVLAHVKWKADIEIEEIFNFFLNPPAKKMAEITWKEPNMDKLVEFMVEKHDFSRKRIEKFAKSLCENLATANERPLEHFFG